MKLRVCIWLVVMVSLLCVSCGGSGSSGPAGEAPVTQDPDLRNAEPYEADSPHALTLKSCVTADTESESCRLTVLPLVGQEDAAPTVDVIMDRVVVSHPWMGERFRVMLEAYLPADILTLLKGVTAIVIDDDIRPSFYTPFTGAIYLDPAYLWLSVDEKQTITQKEDYRSDFGARLQFLSVMRYVKDNNYAYYRYPLDDLSERTFTDIDIPLARVLYHELAHANDFFPPSAIPGLDSNQTVLQAAMELEPSSLSVYLDQVSPLGSQMMLELAGVIYHGDSTTTEQEAYTAEMVGAEFAIDIANDDYAYSGIWEDVAMLFEETMLSYHYGIERDVGYLPIPAEVNPTCDDYLVSWGQRGRIGDPLIKVRAQLVVEELLGVGTLGTFFDDLAAPTALAVDQGWCANLDPAAAALLPEAPVRTLALPLGGERVLEDTQRVD